MCPKIHEQQRDYMDFSRLANQNYSYSQPCLENFPICIFGFQSLGWLSVVLCQFIPVSIHFWRNWSFDILLSWYPNSMPQQGHISKEEHPYLSYGDSSNSSYPHTGQIYFFVFIMMLVYKNSIHYANCLLNFLITLYIISIYPCKIMV